MVIIVLINLVMLILVALLDCSATIVKSRISLYDELSNLPSLRSRQGCKAAMITFFTSSN